MNIISQHPTIEGSIRDTGNSPFGNSWKFDAVESRPGISGNFMIIRKIQFWPMFLTITIFFLPYFPKINFGTVHSKKRSKWTKRRTVDGKCEAFVKFWCHFTSHCRLQCWGIILGWRCKRSQIVEEMVHMVTSDDPPFGGSAIPEVCHSGGPSFQKRLQSECNEFWWGFWGKAPG